MKGTASDEQARGDVALAIEGLADGRSFGLVVIADGVHPWRNSRRDRPGDGPVTGAV
jgi:hypothetical protein